MQHVGLTSHCLLLSLWQDVSKAETERSGPKLGWSGAERELGPRSGERRSEKSGLTQSGKTFRSAPLTCSGYYCSYITTTLTYLLTYLLTCSNICCYYYYHQHY